MSRCSTGLAGLDEILRGGLPAGRLYLLEGSPGSGKTTLALKFLLDGVQRGERVLYITLSETSEELAVVADSHGWTLDGVEVLELSSVAEAIDGDQTVLHPWEVELGETVRLITGIVERTSPARVVFDSLAEMRLLAQDPLRYRRQVLALKQFFAGRAATVVLVDDMAGRHGANNHLHSLAHGVITLERLTPDFGPARRRLQVEKLRGVDFVAGSHDFVIRRGGLVLFPRLVSTGRHAAFTGDAVASGNPALDGLLGGGPPRGTSTLLLGPSGSGKTAIALQYLAAACARGERVALYEFDERVGTMIVRAKAQGLPLQELMDGGLLGLHQVDPAELSPGEFSALVVQEVRERGARMVVIDSLNGFLAAMPQEKQLILHLHELLSFLNQHGVVTFLIDPQHGVAHGQADSGPAISYIADAVLMTAFYEVGGVLRKAIAAVKNRSGAHDAAMRALEVDHEGVRVGAPLGSFMGLVAGLSPAAIGHLPP